MLKINGVSVLTPSKFQISYEDIDSDSSTRDLTGQMHRDRIATKVKIEVGWKNLSSSQISTILQAVAGVFFTVTFPDALTGKTATKNFYVGSRTAPLYNFTLDKWESLDMSLVER